MPGPVGARVHDGSLLRADRKVSGDLVVPAAQCAIKVAMLAATVEPLKARGAFWCLMVALGAFWGWTLGFLSLPLQRNRLEMLADAVQFSLGLINGFRSNTSRRRL